MKLIKYAFKKITLISILIQWIYNEIIQKITSNTFENKTLILEIHNTK